jgi:hypothetical protein
MVGNEKGESVKGKMLIIEEVDRDKILPCLILKDLYFIF